jgi:basic membrane lipoprotein Med (substrate-binding protein (PBP1-ABC) superfamily)
MYTHKKISPIVIALLIVVSLLTTQCAPKAQETAVAPKEDAFKVGLLSPGAVHDGGWNELAYSAIKLIESELGAEISYVEIADTPTVVEKAFRDYADQGYDMVIGHSFSFQDAAEIVAKDYPNTVFLTSGGEKFGSNFAPVVFKENEVAYLMGIIAAHMTKTGKAIAIGGEEMPAISLPTEGLKAGFETVAGNECTLTYINSWTDVGAGKEAALAGFAAGADIVVPNANLAGQGSFQAAQETGGIWAFGTNVDQSSLAPDIIVASTVFDYAKAYLEIAKQIQAGTFEANRVIGMGLKEGAAYVAFNPALKDQIPAEAMKQYEEALQKILSGELDVPGNMVPK